MYENQIDNLLQRIEKTNDAILLNSMVHVKENENFEIYYENEKIQELRIS